MPSRVFVASVLIAWAIFTGWCVWGFPPAVDLPAHGAQLETLKNLLMGDPAVARFYTIKFPTGYGLPYWIFLPLAVVTNGAIAIRFALWVTLQLFPISLLALARVFHRSNRVIFLSLPLAFNFSYWYGLLSGLFAQPLVLFALAAFKRALEQPKKWTWLLLLNALAVVTLMSHLIAFAVLVFLMAILAWMHRPRLASLRGLALGLVLPLSLSLPKAWSMATRAVTQGPWPATELAAASHVNWFFKNYKPEGKLAALAPILTTGLFALVWFFRRKKEVPAAAALFVSMVVLYCITPKTLSGIYLIHVRLPVFAGMLALLLVDWNAIPRLARIALLCLNLASLSETAAFHWRFAREVDGLAEMIQGPPPGKHGYLSVAGKQILGSKNVYAEHLGQWMTATRGGVGHHFFADAEHHPVRFREGVNIPASIGEATSDEVSFFDTILVYGDGQLPSQLSNWRETARVQHWRRLERPDL